MFPILNPPPSSLPRPSLWVVPVHQPQASSIVHWTWTGDSFHTWYYTCFNAILPNLPTLSLSHRVHKTDLYISVSFAVSYTGLLLPSTGDFLNIFFSLFILSIFCIYWDDHMVFMLQFADMMYHIGWLIFRYWKILVSLGWSHLIMVCNLLMYCWIQIARILLRIFASMFISDIGL